MDQLNCQSCYMPMDTEEKFGTTADGGKCEDYCVHCYGNGAFKWEATLDEAVESNIPWWKEAHESDDVARARIMEVFPNLKRWKI